MFGEKEHKKEQIRNSMRVRGYTEGEIDYVFKQVKQRGWDITSSKGIDIAVEESLKIKSE